MSMRRRDALKTIGGLAGLAGVSSMLPACDDPDDGPVGITNYVFLMLENRSYDHVMGARSMLEGKPGDGLVATMTNPDLNGAPVGLYTPQNSIESICVVDDPAHGWDTSRAQFNGGLNDGFVTVHQKKFPTKVSPMQYLTRVEQPVTWALADAYTSCDRWFCSVMGSTIPNRFYWHAATSCGFKSNAVLDDPTPIALETIYHRLTAKNVEWGYYYSSLPLVPAMNERLLPEYKLPTDLIARSVRTFGDTEEFGGRFFQDAAAGTLPPVSYIDPYFYLNDDHPPAHPMLAQQLLAAVYTALANSPQWKNCLLVVTYDEHGGFFDHVPPPKTVDDTLAHYAPEDDGVTPNDFEQCGFRVPAMLIGPYVKKGYISSVQYDHTSALKHLGNIYGLEPLNARMAAANDLMDCIDMERLKKGEWAEPIELPEITLNRDEAFRLQSITGSGMEWPWSVTCIEEGKGMGRLLDPISEAADRNPHLFEGYDLRDQAVPYLQGIDRFLANNKRRS
jgi:phospholipase C